MNDCHSHIAEKRPQQEPTQNNNNRWSFTKADNDDTTISDDTVRKSPGTGRQEEEWMLLCQGAEGRLWKVQNYRYHQKLVPTLVENNSTISVDTTTTPPSASSSSSSFIYCTAVVKERFSKSYRHPILDERLTKHRTKMEAKILNKCYEYIQDQRQQKQQHPTLRIVFEVPKVYHVEYNKNKNKDSKDNDGGTANNNNNDNNTPIQPSSALLYLEYIDGITVREYLHDYEQKLLKQQYEQQQQHRQHNDTAVTDDLDENDTYNYDENDDNDEHDKDDDQDFNVGHCKNDVDVVMEQQKEQHTSICTVAHTLGRTIRELHYYVNLIHGDLTTSNMMLRRRQPWYNKTNASTDTSKQDDDSRVNDRVLAKNDTAEEYYNLDTICMIDFGLGKVMPSINTNTNGTTKINISTTTCEERAVDLYVLERALISTHPTVYKLFWYMFLKSYRQQEPEQQQQQQSNNEAMSTDHQKSIEANIAATLKRYEQVRQRGRKRECFG